ncbi:MAG TPA: chloride channel protein [Longimicrobiales bacterium]|nr:chloride channel protein [Longimicrobiales bacterium]
MLRRAGRSVGHGWDTFITWFSGLGLSEDTIMLVFGAVLGVVGAGGVIIFFRLMDLAHEALFVWLANKLPHPEFPLYRPLLTAVGVAVAVWLVRRFGTTSEEDRKEIRSVQLVPTIQVAVARRGGVIDTRTAVSRIAASAITLGSGGSAGSEGPVAVVGSTVGSFLGRAFHFDTSRIRVLVGAGAAAGISAAFNAPLAASFFALEEIMGTFTAGAFPPVVIAAVVAAVISRSVFGNHPAIALPAPYSYHLNREVLLFFPLLGVLCGLVTVLFVRIFFGSADLIRKLHIRPSVLPWLGGAVVGTLVLLSGGMLINWGHLAVRMDLFSQMSWTTLALLGLGNMVATSLTLNSGGSGGVFAPSLYVGAATGGAFGILAASIFPTLNLHPQPYMLVGMGAVFAAATDAPLAAILIVFELTNDYAIVLPLMLTVVIAYRVAKWVEPDSLYSGWLRRRGESISHGANEGVLTRLKVSDAAEENPQVIGEGATVAKLIEHLGEATQLEYPVVDDDLRPVGMISIAGLGRVAKESNDIANLVVASDVASPTETVTPDDSLLTAIRRMGVRGTHTLPIVDPASGKLVGVVGRAGILSLYERTVAEEQAE